jgi:hypothetical protein
VNYIKHSQNNYSKKIITHFVELCTSVFKSIKTEFQCDIIAVDHNPRPFKRLSIKENNQKRLKAFYFKYIRQVSTILKATY